MGTDGPHVLGRVPQTHQPVFPAFTESISEDIHHFPSAISGCLTYSSKLTTARPFSRPTLLVSWEGRGTFYILLFKLYARHPQTIPLFFGGKSSISLNPSLGTTNLSSCFSYTFRRVQITERTSPCIKEMEPVTCALELIPLPCLPLNIIILERQLTL